MKHFVIAMLFVCSLAWADQKPQCKKPQPKPTPTPTQPSDPSSSSTSGSSSSASSNASAASTSSSVSSANQTQSQQQSQTAQGGNASATGGDASASNNGSNVAVTNQTNVAAPKIPVSSAFSAAYPTAPCVVGMGAGVQTMAAGVSLSGGKVDKNCQALELARSFYLAGSKLAGCKVLIRMKGAKEAGISLEDCMSSVEPAEKAEVIVPAPQPVVLTPQPPTIVLVNTQPLEVTPTPQEVREAGLAPVKTAQSRKPAVHRGKPCVVPESLKTPLTAEK